MKYQTHECQWSEIKYHTRKTTHRGFFITTEYTNTTMYQVCEICNKINVLN